MTGVPDPTPFALADEFGQRPVSKAETLFDGAVVGVRRDTLEGDDGAYRREVISHPGAVGVVAVDADDRVLVIRQYRHPAGGLMIEVPAGLLDVDGEPPLEAARRELQEEALLVAQTWSSLVTYIPSAGISEERIEVFLAEDVASADAPDGYVARHEEADLQRQWVPLQDLVGAVMTGAVTNGLTVVGSLALWAKRHGGADLRVTGEG